MSASPPATTSALAVRQGKTRARDLAWLPKDVLSLVLTHVLLKTAQGPYTQSSWDSEPELWQQREAFVTLKLAQAALNLVNVCPPWHKALNDHPFWRTACHVMDPADHYPTMLAYYSAPAAAAQGMSAVSVRRFRPSADTYRHLTNFFCAACRINRAFDRREGASVMLKRWMPSSHFGLVAVCREHKFVTLCGVCLRESSGLAPPESPFEPGVTENDDDEVFPGLAATCTSCRQDALCSHLDRAGLLSTLGGRNFDKAEADLKNLLDSYVDLADGDVNSLVIMAAERVWLRDHTRMREMMAQMIAASRYHDGEDAEMLADEDDEDMDLDASWAEEANARELSLGEWARTRILDGVWTAPGDDYGRPELIALQQNNAVHPIPALVDAKPQPFKPHAPIPAAGLAHHVSRAYGFNLRTLLWPALINVAQRLIVAHDGNVERAQEEACSISRSPELVNWVLARCAEEKSWRQIVPAGAPPPQRHVHSRSDSSSTSSVDGERSPTSPASTTTMRTTPDSEALGAPVAHAVPWVPAALPRGAGPLPETRFVLERVWKDACCAAMYTPPCRCAACLRIAPPETRKRSSEEMSSNGDAPEEKTTYKRQRTDSLDSNRARAATIEPDAAVVWPSTPIRDGRTTPTQRDEDVDMAAAEYYGEEEEEEDEEDDDEPENDEDLEDALKMSLAGT
ncbi:hypothetical protein AURDEDRAFT_152052 [Auricularia subglabra TFB-10046 SS5]|nr:hypothetical protein AURDEDRAFT_152052 [Auricularia subglabra TFB-10046 SS5]